MRTHIKFTTLIVLICIFSALAGSACASANNPSQLYAQACALLTSGRDYDQAASLLREAVRLQPKNSAYHLALGCAYADRAASIAHAVIWRHELADDKAQYPQQLADWKTAQSDPKNYQFGEPKPVPPPNRQFPTKDDGKPLKLTDLQEFFEVGVLEQKAKSEWANSVSHARSQQERDMAEYTFGWGIALFLEYKEVTALNDTASSLADDDSALLHFLNATRHDPENAHYWLGLGDFFWSERYSDFYTTSIDNPKLLSMLFDAFGTDLTSPVQPADVMQQAYLKALTIQPNNSALWYRLCALVEKHNPTQATLYLNQAIRYDPDSAILHYRLAGLIFDKTHYGDIFRPLPSDHTKDMSVPDVAKQCTDTDKQTAQPAIDEILQGNTCQNENLPEYTSPIPALIMPAWEYEYVLQRIDDLATMGADARLRNLARQVKGYADVSSYNHDSASALHAADALIAMGYKMAGTWPTTEKSYGNADLFPSLVGIAVIAIGDYAKIDVYKELNDADGVKQATDQYNAFMQREKAHQKQVMAHVGEHSLYDAY